MELKSISAVSYQLAGLEAKGLLRRDPGRPRAIELAQSGMDLSLRRLARFAAAGARADGSFRTICHDGRVNSPLGVRVRPARMTDHDALTEVDALAWSADSGFPSTMSPGARDGLFFTTDSPPEAHLVVELDGSVVGYIRLKPPTRLPENAHVIQVQGLAVHPDARGHGAAGSLLDAAAEQMRERGIRKLTLRVLSTNEAAIRLYERHGFAREGTQCEEFLINGRSVDDILMAKRL